MWIGRDFVEELRSRDKASSENNIAQRLDNMKLVGENGRLTAENAHLKTTLDWFKHRLNQVEMERAQLIYAATGGTGAIPREVKIPVPNFLGGEPLVSDVLNTQYNPFGTTGGDSDDAGDQAPQHEDISHMPRFGR